MDGDVDWRKELLQAVRSVFDSERKWLHAQLQDVMATNSSIDYSSLLKHLEMLLQKQVLKCCQLFYSYSSALHITISALVCRLLLCHFWCTPFLLLLSVCLTALKNSDKQAVGYISEL